MIELARILGAFGIKGWVKVQAYNPSSQTLFRCKNWRLRRAQLNAPKASEAAQSIVKEISLTMLQIRPHGTGLIAKFKDVDDRDAAQALRGYGVWVDREALPELNTEGEYYWIDLIGLSVINREGRLLGVVTDLMETGAHDVLCVGEQLLIPFVMNVYIDQVNVETRVIHVDWPWETNENELEDAH